MQERGKGVGAHEFADGEVGKRCAVAFRVTSDTLAIGREIVARLLDTRLNRRAHKRERVGNVLPESAELASGGEGLRILVIRDTEGSNYSKHSFTIGRAGIVCRRWMGLSGGIR